jgi:hypothetical protein
MDFHEGSQMISIEYRELIRSLCEEVDLQSWEDIYKDGEIRVDGLDIALVHDEVDAPDFLSIYIDLCVNAPQDSLKLRLLEHSMTSHPSQGCFGFLPMTDKLLYRVNLSCSSVTTGAKLLSLLRFHLDAAQRGLAACSAAI